MLYNTATRFAFLSPFLLRFSWSSLSRRRVSSLRRHPQTQRCYRWPASRSPLLWRQPRLQPARRHAALKLRMRRSVLRSCARFVLPGRSSPARLSGGPNRPYIVAEATALNNDPNVIFAFVRDQVANQVYSGSFRGARGALWTMGGNSLDKASLLIVLLGAAGIQSQYAQGTLGATDAANAILTMFPTPTIVGGCIPPGTTLASPQTDPTLLATAANHYWVQYGATDTAPIPAFPAPPWGRLSLPPRRLSHPFRLP